jgi:hypothetical protein
MPDTDYRFKMPDDSREMPDAMRGFANYRDVPRSHFECDAREHLRFT